MLEGSQTSHPAYAGWRDRHTAAFHADQSDFIASDAVSNFVIRLALAADGRLNKSDNTTGNPAAFAALPAASDLSA
ncbi:MAG: hypothetical protein JSR74_11060 [Proteobacteria bacterium]|nr:hypothetical protein [Pseudomonadota bacterium]